MCAVALIAIGVCTAAVVRPLDAARDESRQAGVDDIALQHLDRVRTALADLQVFFEPGFASVSLQTPQSLAQGALLYQTYLADIKALVASLPATGLDQLSRDITTASTAFGAQIEGLGPVASGETGPAIDALVAVERTGYQQMWTLVGTATTQLAEARDSVAQQSAAHINDARVMSLIMGTLGAILALVGAITFGHRAHRREWLDRTNARRQAYEASLQEALDMAKDEPAVYAIMSKALGASLPRLQVQTLVADSSRAHFLETVNTGRGRPDERSGCGVVSPQECPATVRGETLVFSSSAALNACPYLQDRLAGECSAVCVPISIAGKTVGVAHAIGPDGVPPDEADVRSLETTSRRSSERLAMLRAFEKSETQAHSDPLTGLWNRRSLENRVHDLQREGVDYALAYGDLDHFKLLNDTHGHEAGDQALRLFSRVLRDSIRPNDIAARYGGEEFVIVLPDADVQAATLVLDRVRERLALALTTGRVAAFTVSFGLAGSGDADTFENVVAVADGALLQAKAAGRNRVVTARAGGPEDDGVVDTDGVALSSGAERSHDLLQRQ